MVGFWDFDGEKHSAQAALFAGEERVCPDRKRAENRFCRASEAETTLGIHVNIGINLT